MRSLRGRLTLGLSVILALVLLAAGRQAALEVERSERAAVDDRLKRTAELSLPTALAAVNEELPDPDDRLNPALSATRTSLRLVLGSSVLFERGRRPPAPTRRPALGLSTYAARGERYRAYVARLDDPALGRLARLEVVTPLAGVEARQADLRSSLLVVGAIALGLGAAGVWLASGVILRPVRRLRRTTASIAEDEDLSRRVPSGGPTEMRALAGSFNAMLARLSRSATDRERALAATRRFAADAGHELRTPLTSIQATLSALARHPGLDAERRTRMANEALAEQDRLVGLLDGLQALARGDAAPALEAVDLADVVDAALDAARGRHPEAAFAASLPDGPVTIRGWEPGLRSLLDNLLENAVRHGRAGGRVEVSLVREPGATDLVVEDDGPGVPEAERERVFEPFARLDGARAPGSGLGLALVAQQARLHGATVAVDPSPGLGGARFSVAFRGR
jgi:signal transduction histidine kinase